MNDIESCAFTGQEDVRDILALVGRRAPERAADYPGLLDLEEVLMVPEIQRNCALWRDARGNLLAFAFLDDTSLAFEMAAGMDLGGQILAWADKQARAADGNAETLSTGCRAENLARVRLLEAHGFQPEPVRSLHFRRDLSQPIPPACLPEGFSIRPVAGEQEVEALVALHRAAHHSDYMTAALRLASMRTASYERALDLVAVAPNGELAAYTICSINPRENALRGLKVGTTDPVATHPAYQRLGLARALLLSGFARLKERGMDYAETSTYGENEGMIRTARSAGFEVVSTTVFYTREIKT